MMYICKYSKFMNKRFNSLNRNIDPLKDVEKSSFEGSAIHIKEDDQDWGSAGMNDIQANS